LRERLRGRGGGGHNLRDHSSQDWMARVKGLMGTKEGAGWWFGGVLLSSWEAEGEGAVDRWVGERDGEVDIEGRKTVID